MLIAEYSASCQTDFFLFMSFQFVVDCLNITKIPSWLILFNFSWKYDARLSKSFCQYQVCDIKTNRLALCPILTSMGLTYADPVQSVFVHSTFLAVVEHTRRRFQNTFYLLNFIQLLHGPILLTYSGRETLSTFTEGHLWHWYMNCLPLTSHLVAACSFAHFGVSQIIGICAFHTITSTRSFGETLLFFWTSELVMYWDESYSRASVIVNRRLFY